MLSKALRLTAQSLVPSLAQTLAALTLLLGTALTATPASAQSYDQGYSQGYGQDYDQNYSQTYGSAYRDCGGCGHPRPYRRDYSFQGQADVPGDYRCDAYWDRGRTDCDVAARDQRSPWRRQTSHYGHGEYRSRGGYGGSVYPGAYGRPDVIHSGTGYGQYGRDRQRVDWCCAQYRSYDPTTGYYVAYSGERVFCG